MVVCSVLSFCSQLVSPHPPPFFVMGLIHFFLCLISCILFPPLQGKKMFAEKNNLPVVVFPVLLLPVQVLSSSPVVSQVPTHNYNSPSLSLHSIGQQYFNYQFISHYYFLPPPLSTLSSGKILAMITITCSKSTNATLENPIRATRTILIFLHILLT